MFDAYGQLLAIWNGLGTLVSGGGNGQLANAATMTIAKFVKHLAGLGGHLGRKRDGRPGWQTLWRDLEKLLLILRGIQAAKQNCG
ncbi:hypothetical protein [Planctomicrobium sp. SH527]|uniref:hypothetical protein n=1 Tax=Planctomicrobium sp. SH527 TaxID=3448123 RepID=UPI003F5B2AA1